MRHDKRSCATRLSSFQTILSKSYFLFLVPAHTIFSSCSLVSHAMYKSLCLVAGKCQEAVCTLQPWSAWADMSSPVSGYCASQSRRRRYRKTWRTVIQTSCSGLSQTCNKDIVATREKSTDDIFVSEHIFSRIDLVHHHHHHHHRHHHHHHHHYHHHHHHYHHHHHNHHHHHHHHHHYHNHHIIIITIITIITTIIIIIAIINTIIIIIITITIEPPPSPPPSLSFLSS